MGGGHSINKVNIVLSKALLSLLSTLTFNLRNSVSVFSLGLVCVIG